MVNPKQMMLASDMMEALISGVVADWRHMTYPPHNIVLNDDKSVTIEIAAAGFNDKELEVTVSKGKLDVCGAKTPDDYDEFNGNPVFIKRKFLHNGLARRNFQLQWSIPTNYEVSENIKFQDGILTITLERIEPPQPEVKKLKIG